MVDHDIVDAIENGSFGYAGSLIDFKLQRHPQSSYYQALRIYLNYHMGKVDDAKQQGEKLLQKSPSDPNTLSTLFQVYHKAGAPKEAHAVYERALKRYPTSESIAKSWFENSLGSFDLRGIQLSSMHLQRSFKSNRKYVLWACFGCLALCDSGIEGKERSLFSTLGLKLMEAIMPLVNSQEVYVYSKLLFVGEKYVQAVEFVRDQKQQHLELETKELYLRALQMLAYWDEIYQFTEREIFVEDFNDYDTWRLFLRASFEIGKSMEETRKRIEEAPYSRNTRLILLEVAAVFGQSLLVPSIEYYKHYGSKNCSFYDVKYYKNSFDLVELIEYFKDKCGNLLADGKTTDDMTFLVNYQKLVYLSNKDGSDFIKRNHEIYNKFKDILKNKEPTDFYLPNELMLMNAIISLKADKSFAREVNTICTLEGLLLKDEYNFSLRLWLMKLYQRMNCHSLVFYNYKKLKIKMIQHDTLSDFLLQKCIDPSASSLKMLTDVYRFYLTAEMEVNTSIMNGFEKGSYTKLESFIRFGNKIQNSLSKYKLILEIIRITRLRNEKKFSNHFNKVLRDLEPSILNETLTIYDNRDKNVQWSFGTNDALAPGLLDQQPAWSSEFVKLRIIKELLILDCKSKNATKLFKLFNKCLESKLYMMQLSDFEKWLFRVYLSTFKLFTQKSPKERESLINYLTKNLKAEKVRAFFEVKHTTTISDLQYYAISFYDLAKVFLILVDQDLSTVLNACYENIKKALKSIDLKTPQLEELKNIKSSINLSNLDVNSTMIDEIFDSMDASIKESSSLGSIHL